MQGCSFEDPCVVASPLSAGRGSQMSHAINNYHNQDAKARSRRGKTKKTYMTSTVTPSFDVCLEGTNSTMWSVTDKSQSISLLHLAFLSAGIGSKRDCSLKTDADWLIQEHKRKCYFFYQFKRIKQSYYKYTKLFASKNSFLFRRVKTKILAFKLFVCWNISHNKSFTVPKNLIFFK